VASKGSAGEHVNNPPNVVKDEEQVWGEERDVYTIDHEVGEAEFENGVLEGAVGGIEEPGPDEALSTCNKRSLLVSL
jgi:hypothetical protein